jgi:hypothetical protein
MSSARRSRGITPSKFEFFSTDDVPHNGNKGYALAGFPLDSEFPPLLDYLDSSSRIANAVKEFKKQQTLDCFQALVPARIAFAKEHQDFHHHSESDDGCEGRCAYT